MLPGYHDVIAVTIPAFTSLVETNGAAQFASLPSLHVAWAIWAAIALCTVVRKPLLRILVWLYPVVTVTDVLATGNHYLLDIITAPGLLLLGYAVALTPAFVRKLRHGQLGRALLLRCQDWNSQVLHGQARQTWLRYPQMLPAPRQPETDPEARRKLVCTGNAPPDDGRSPGER
jgi:hypothetical protein